MDIGNKLKSQREKLGLGIDDVSSITKMNTGIIRAIETDNISAFSHDLTYYRYYVKSYCRAVEFDYNLIEEDVKEASQAYTTTITKNEKEKLEEITENVKVKAETIQKSHKKVGLKHKPQGMDWSLVSLLIVGSLILVFIGYTALSKLRTPNIPDPGIVKPDPNVPVTPVEPTEDKIVITVEDPTTYRIKNWDKKDDFVITTIFGTNTWVELHVNDVLAKIPVTNEISKTFEKGTKLNIGRKYTIGDQEFDFKAGDVITVRYGIINTNTFEINGEPLQLDSSVANLSDAVTIKFVLEGSE